MQHEKNAVKKVVLRTNSNVATRQTNKLLSTNAHMSNKMGGTFNILASNRCRSKQARNSNTLGREKKSVQIAMRTFHCDSWRQKWRFGRTCHNPFPFCKEPHQLFLLKWRAFFSFNPRNSRISKGDVLPTNFTVAKTSMTLWALMVWFCVFVCLAHHGECMGSREDIEYRLHWPPSSPTPFHISIVKASAASCFRSILYATWATTIQACNEKSKKQSRNTRNWRKLAASCANCRIALFAWSCRSS